MHSLRAISTSLFHMRQRVNHLIRIYFESNHSTEIIQAFRIILTIYHSLNLNSLAYLGSRNYQCFFHQLSSSFDFVLLLGPSLSHHSNYLSLSESQQFSLFRFKQLPMLFHQLSSCFNFVLFYFSHLHVSCLMHFCFEFKCLQTIAFEFQLPLNSLCC